MHYYGTYAMARAAGLESKHAKVIAYAAQYVDESTDNVTLEHPDGGMFQNIATAHTNSEVIANQAANQTEQRNVWVPFHFYPGNEGGSLSKKLLCVKDSLLAQEMVSNHIDHALSVKEEYGAALMGIMAHVYSDTFSHYGFSGVSSRENKVDADSFILDVKDPDAKAYIMNKFNTFIEKYTPTFITDNYRKLASSGAEVMSAALGHGAVGTYPDRPFLKWEFIYEQNSVSSGIRNNLETFLEACEKLHAAFSLFASKANLSVNPVQFSDIKEKIIYILSLEANEERRTEEWIKAIVNGDLFQVNDEALVFEKSEWESQKEAFNELRSSSEIISSDVYRFQQAAIYHRDYTLKQLLPKYGISVL